MSPLSLGTDTNTPYFTNSIFWPFRFMDNLLKIDSGLGHSSYLLQTTHTIRLSSSDWKVREKIIMLKANLLNYVFVTTLAPH